MPDKIKKQKIISTFDLETSLLEKGYTLMMGIDEVGRGPLAGPVVASAAVWKKKVFDAAPEDAKQYGMIRDSKILSEKQRESLYDFICENFYIGIGICDHNTIDRINILEATYLAMKSALSDLRSKCSYQNEKCIILVDGNKKIPNLTFEQLAIVGGDKTVKSISAASIIAKVTRDRMMHDMDKVYPQYDFSKHKGYGTRSHMEALKKYGLCEIHRKSFCHLK